MHSGLSNLQEILVEILSDSDQRIKRIIPKGSISSQFQRPIYQHLVKQASSFSKSQKGSRWNVMVGLRGVGKTTLLAQLYLHPDLKAVKKFYLSFDRAQLMGTTINDLESALGSILGKKLLKTHQPIFLFLDEVHSLKDWSLLCKALYDDYPNLFLICTSSSALSLWTNPDTGRRVQYFQVSPLSLSESLLLKEGYAKQLDGVSRRESDAFNQLSLSVTLGNKIKNSLFNQSSAITAYNHLKTLQEEVDLYFSKIDPVKAINDYVLNYGTLPYVFDLAYQLEDPDHKKEDTTFRIRSAIRQTLEKVYLTDLSLINRTDQPVRNFPRLLLWLANAEQVSLNKISKGLGLNFRTLQTMLETLANSEILLPIQPFGASFGKATKPAKYLFKCPAIRQSLCALKTRSEFNRLRGHLLEDINRILFEATI